MVLFPILKNVVNAVESSTFLGFLVGRRGSNFNSILIKENDWQNRRHFKGIIWLKIFMLLKSHPSKTAFFRVTQPKIILSSYFLPILKWGKISFWTPCSKKPVSCMNLFEVKYVIQSTLLFGFDNGLFEGRSYTFLRHPILMVWCVCSTTKVVVLRKSISYLFLDPRSAEARRFMKNRGDIEFPKLS